MFYFLSLGRFLLTFLYKLCSLLFIHTFYRDRFGSFHDEVLNAPRMFKCPWGSVQIRCIRVIYLISPVVNEILLCTTMLHHYLEGEISLIFSSCNMIAILFMTIKLTLFPKKCKEKRRKRRRMKIRITNRGLEKGKTKRSRKEIRRRRGEEEEQ